MSSIHLREAEEAVELAESAEAAMATMQASREALAAELVASKETIQSLRRDLSKVKTASEDLKNADSASALQPPPLVPLLKLGAILDQPATTTPKLTRRRYLVSGSAKARLQRDSEREDFSPMQGKRISLPSGVPDRVSYKTPTPDTPPSSSEMTWHRAKAPNGNYYYYNAAGEVSWKMPSSDGYKL